MDAVRIEDVIGDFVSLKKRGANHIGCCPFHNEKTPSFYVSPSKGIYKCFGCGKAGNAITFLMEHERYSYADALRYLANKYNIEIQEEKLTDEQIERNNERDALFHVTEYAQKYFADLLWNNEDGRNIGLSYFHQRGMSDEIIKAFGLGYCLEQWDNFTLKARADGYSDQVLEKSGLTIFKEDGKKYDRFRGRVVFPIYSVSGRVLGFSARILSKEKQAAKYVNSPDSDIYDKGHTLYGIYQAKNSITRADKCYLVEGNIDVVSMHQSGITNTVASCGTSLTVEQIRIIKRYTKNITVVYDGDKAGIKATNRATDLLFAEGMHVSMVLFPDDDDPDSYAQKHGSTALQQYLDEHEDNFIVYRTKTLAEGFRNDPIRKTEAVREIINTIALVPDMLERTEYVALCASLMQMPEQTLGNELAKTILANKRNAARNADTGAAAQDSANGDGQEHPDTQQPTGETAEQVANRVAPTEEQELERLKLSAIDQNELKIIQLLLNYGDRIINVNTSDDPKAPCEEYYVSAFVIGELANDDITLCNPLCKYIFDIYQQNLLDNNLIDASYFVNSTDPQISELAISLMIDPHKLSELWREKGMHIPTEQEMLLPDVYETINTYKLSIIERKIKNTDDELRTLTNPDDIDILLAKKIQYQGIRNKIASKLNRVIC